MKEPKKNIGFATKWRRRKLAFACLLIAFCFLLGNDIYRAKAIVVKNKELFDNGKKIVNYLDARRNHLFQSDFNRKFWLSTNQNKQKSLLKTLIGADVCGATATAITALPYNDASTTVGLTDNYDLPPDTTSPTLTGCPSCTATGKGPTGSLPRGAVYTGTGTGPDAAYRIQFATANNTLNVSMTPTSGQDLALIVYTDICSSSLADGIVISDQGVANGNESVTISTMPAGTYHIVIDGYSAGAAAPGPSGAYTLAVTGTNQPVGTTAAEASVSGRVVNAQGRGIARVLVSVTDTNGQTHFVTTNPFGYYRIDALNAGETYIFSTSSKGYKFPAAKAVSLNQSLEDFNFTALP